MPRNRKQLRLLRRRLPVLRWLALRLRLVRQVRLVRLQPPALLPLPRLQQQLPRLAPRRLPAVATRRSKAHDPPKCERFDERLCANS